MLAEEKFHITFPNAIMSFDGIPELHRNQIYDSLLANVSLSFCMFASFVHFPLTFYFFLLVSTPPSTDCSPSVTIRCNDGLIFLKNTSTEEEEVVLQRGNKKATVPLGACVQLRALDLIHIDDKLTMRWEPSAAFVKASPRGKKERRQPLVLPSNEKEEEEVTTR
jgi:hypothetical protein